MAGERRFCRRRRVRLASLVIFFYIQVQSGVRLLISLPVVMSKGSPERMDRALRRAVIIVSGDLLRRKDLELMDFISRSRVWGRALLLESLFLVTGTPKTFFVTRFVSPCCDVHCQRNKSVAYDSAASQ